MKKSKRLEPVARVARQKELGAAAQYSNSLRQVEQHENQLGELIAYWKQYTERLERAGQTGFSILQMRDYQVFLNRLNDAIVQQKQMIKVSHQDCKENQVNWHGYRSNSKMINKVVENHLHAENKKKEDREQRELDDRPKGKSLKDIN